MVFESFIIIQKCLKDKVFKFEICTPIWVPLVTLTLFNYTVLIFFNNSFLNFVVAYMPENDIYLVSCVMKKLFSIVKQKMCSRQCYWYAFWYVQALRWSRMWYRMTSKLPEWHLANQFWCTVNKPYPYTFVNFFQHWTAFYSFCTKRIKK